MNQNQLDQKRKWVTGKFIVGIDPAKDKHQATIIDDNGNIVGKSFSFEHNAFGFHEKLWDKLKRYLAPESIQPAHLIFAVEAAVDFWQPLVNYLHKLNFPVLIVSPLTTKRSRALPGHDFSRTDPKDARLVAESAFRGHYHRYVEYSEQVNALKTLSLTYCKIRKNLFQNQHRLRSTIARVFPEFLTIVPPHTDTARFLLANYLHPRDFLNLDVSATAVQILKISKQQHGLQTLLDLQNAAQHSIGLQRNNAEIISDRLTVNSWLAIIATLQNQLDNIAQQLIGLAKQTPWFDILVSIKGVSDLSAALFIAEVKDLARFQHFKQIQKLAGLNLRLNDSGRTHGRHKINKIGNRRLRWIIFLMTQETIKYIPEVRIKYLKRRLNANGIRTKNIVACSSQLLQLIMALIKNNHFYQFLPQNQALAHHLEEQLHQKTTAKQQHRKPIEIPVF
ncbi:IS110 family transposase [candidate division KSB1 bacterium]|nr:MAG: IS110 family transposase [candidate division KSB1 bacterium]